MFSGKMKAYEVGTRRGEEDLQSPEHRVRCKKVP
jgi:hypothetical protein